MPSSRLLVVLLVPAFLVGGVVFLVMGTAEDDAPPPRTLPPGVPEEAYRSAEQEFTEQYARTPSHLDTLDWLAEREARTGDLEIALAAFAEIPTDDPDYGRAARYQQGQVLLRLERAVEAEAQFRTFLALEARSQTRPAFELVDAIQRLRYILEVELRFEERAHLIKGLVLSDAGNEYDTMFYCFPNLLFWNGTTAFRELEAFHENDPDDRHINVALGRFLVARGRPEDGERVLRRCLEEWPDDLAVIAAHLEYLETIGDVDELDERASHLPPVGGDDPWLLLRLRGEYHVRAEEYEAATNAFEKLLAADPASAAARQGLAEVYRRTGRDEDRERMLRESALLARIQNLLGRGQVDESDAETFLEVARLAAEAGLRDRALIVARLVQRLGDHPEAAEFIASLGSTPEPEPLR